jgi:hypothetical protein
MIKPLRASIDSVRIRWVRVLANPDSNESYIRQQEAVAAVNLFEAIERHLTIARGGKSKPKTRGDRATWSHRCRRVDWRVHPIISQIAGAYVIDGLEILNTVILILMIGFVILLIRTPRKGEKKARIDWHRIGTAIGVIIALGLGFLGFKSLIDYEPPKPKSEVEIEAQKQLFEKAIQQEKIRKWRPELQ